jgi:hypothetical protein
MNGLLSEVAERIGLSDMKSAAAGVCPPRVDGLTPALSDNPALPPACLSLPALDALQCDVWMRFALTAEGPLHDVVERRR